MLEHLNEIEADIHYAFEDVKLLTAALTHSSYANESGEGEENNERLEFLGDAVLELCVSEELYRRFPDAPEGALTLMRSKLVSEPGLASLARGLGLGRRIRLGKGEENQGGRDRSSLLGDVLEAVLGAVFLDGGFEAARAVILAVFADKWPEAPPAARIKDAKSRLQEYMQKRFKARPFYALKRSFGPEHEKRFEVGLTLPTGEETTATGSSVKKAEQKAAAKALNALAAKEEREGEEPHGQKPETPSLEDGSEAKE